MPAPCDWPTGEGRGPTSLVHTNARCVVNAGNCFEGGFSEITACELPAVPARCWFLSSFSFVFQRLPTCARTRLCLCLPAQACDRYPGRRNVRHRLRWLAGCPPAIERGLRHERKLRGREQRPLLSPMALITTFPVAGASLQEKRDGTTQQQQVTAHASLQVTRVQSTTDVTIMLRTNVPKVPKVQASATVDTEPRNQTSSNRRIQRFCCS